MEAIIAAVGSLFPLTVVVALILFILRETLELIKKHREKTRKLQAIKKMTARELELNLGAIKSVEEIIKTIRSPRDNAKRQLVITRSETGDRYFKVLDAKDNILSGMALREVRSETMSKYMVDVAALDECLFKKFEDAYDATMELAHVWRSLIQHVNNKPENYLLDGFDEYALGELADSEKALDVLYKACTGKPLDSPRLR
jgi:hypothetical protein